jgi:type VI protein secretion system component VasK
LRNYTILRLLLAGFLLYVAWPYFPNAITTPEKIFWGSWIAFALLVIGANLATLLQLITPPVMEQEKEKRRQIG